LLHLIKAGSTIVKTRIVVLIEMLTKRLIC
jgi:hypothetical protein